MRFWKRDQARVDFLVKERFPAAADDLQFTLFQYVGEGLLTSEDTEIVERLIADYELSKGDVNAPPTVDNELAAFVEAKEWLNALCAYRDQLETSQPTDIAKLYEEAMRPILEERQQNAVQEDESDFFNEEAASRGLDQWLLLPMWTVDEAVAVSLGKNPTVVNASTLSGPFASSPFRREFRRRSDVIRRAIVAGDLTEPLRPQGVLKWVLGQEAFDGLNKQVLGISAEEVAPNEPKLHGSIENSLRKLVLGLAVKYYRLSLKPEENVGSEAWAAISKDLAEIGLEVHSDTVNKHVTESLEKARSHAGDSKDGKKFSRTW